MKFLLKYYMLSMVSLSLALVPVGYVGAKTTSQKSTYASDKSQSVKESKRKKARARVNARKARLKVRRIARAKQRAIDLGENYDGSVRPRLASGKALVVSQSTGEVKYAKNTHISSPIASITKLMTAMVVLDAQQPMDDIIYISDEDVDTIKGTRSRLPVGSSLHRSDMLQLALMSSENRAAFSLASNYPGGRGAFVKAMNAKALFLGLMDTHFTEPTGLMYQNISTAEDLYGLVAAAYQYPEIRAATTTHSYEVYINGNRRPTVFKNTNRLVRSGKLDIGLSKTGYITEAGRCLVMQSVMGGEPVIVVLLDAAGTNKRTGDVNRLRKWVEYGHGDTGVVEERDILEPKLVMSGRIYEN